MRRPTLLLGELMVVVLAFALVAAAAPTDDAGDPQPGADVGACVTSDGVAVDAAFRRARLRGLLAALGAGDAEAALTYFDRSVHWELNVETTLRRRVASSAIRSGLHADDIETLEAIAGELAGVRFTVEGAGGGMVYIGHESGPHGGMRLVGVGPIQWFGEMERDGRVDTFALSGKGAFVCDSGRIGSLLVGLCPRCEPSAVGGNPSTRRSME